MNAIALRTSSKKRDNKGFSLVELIIVIAIMAVLTAILAPQLLRYVERSRQAKDATTLDEVQRAISIALADEGTWTAIASTTGTFTATYRNGTGAGATATLTFTGGADAANNAFAAEVHRTLGGSNSTNVVSGLPMLVSRARLNGNTTVTPQNPAGAVVFTITLTDGNVNVRYV